MADLDSRLLRAFVAVAEELNFTRAAHRPDTHLAVGNHGMIDPSADRHLCELLRGGFPVPFDVARVMAAQEERGTHVVGPPLAPAGA